MNINIKGRKRHDSEFRKKFGIGLIQYQAVLEEQEGRCYLCQRETVRNLAVDHDHKTGRVRRLLCSTCNTGLGNFRDNPELLIRAAEYVETRFELPPDVPIETKLHKNRPRWHHVITTPEREFHSLAKAADYYHVHPTTIGYWCGVFKHHKHLRREGFKSERTFSV